MVSGEGAAAEVDEGGVHHMPVVRLKIDVPPVLMMAAGGSVVFADPSRIRSTEKTPNWSGKSSASGAA